MHDWTRVTPNSFHAFHVAWVAALQQSLNRGVLPRGYYALAEQTSPPIGPNVLTLHRPTSSGSSRNGESSGGTAVLQRKPKVRISATGTDRNTFPQRRISIRHNSDDRLIALLEIVSPGNKSSTSAFRAFQEKMLGALRQGLHCLVIDLFPPSPRDPAGLPSALWKRLVGEPLAPLSARERSLLSIEVGPSYHAYVQPQRIGDKLTTMPMFIEMGRYVDVPLELTYRAAWDGIPEEIHIQLV